MSTKSRGMPPHPLSVVKLCFMMSQWDVIFWRTDLTKYSVSCWTFCCNVLERKWVQGTCEEAGIGEMRVSKLAAGLERSKTEWNELNVKVFVKAWKSKSWATVCLTRPNDNISMNVLFPADMLIFHTCATFFFPDGCVNPSRNWLIKVHATIYSFFAHCCVSKAHLTLHLHMCNSLLRASGAPCKLQIGK